MIHLRVVCKEHNVVIEQCKCINDNKVEVLVDCRGTCNKCQHDWEWTDAKQDSMICSKCSFEVKVRNRSLSDAERALILAKAENLKSRGLL